MISAIGTRVDTRQRHAPRASRVGKSASLILREKSATSPGVLGEKKITSPALAPCAPLIVMPDRIQHRFPLVWSEGNWVDMIQSAQATRGRVGLQGVWGRLWAQVVVL